MTPSPPVREIAVTKKTTLTVELLDAETNQTAYNQIHTIRTELRIQDPLRPKSHYLTLSANGTTIWQSVLHECEYERIRNVRTECDSYGYCSVLLGLDITTAQSFVTLD